MKNKNSVWALTLKVLITIAIVWIAGIITAFFGSLFFDSVKAVEAVVKFVMELALSVLVVYHIRNITNKTIKYLIFGMIAINLMLVIITSFVVPLCR